MGSRSRLQAKIFSKIVLRMEILGATNLLEADDGISRWCKCEVMTKDGRRNPPSCKTGLISGTSSPEWKEKHDLIDWRVGEELSFTILHRQQNTAEAKAEAFATLSSEQFEHSGFDGSISLKGPGLKDA